MIEFLFAIALGVGSVVLATISLGELVEGSKKGKYEISIGLYKVEGLNRYNKTQELKIDGKVHKYSVSQLSPDKLIIGDYEKPMSESTALRRIGDDFVGYTDDSNIEKIAEIINNTETKKIDEKSINIPSKEIDWIK
ncbi:MAG: hypothetical protein GQ477_04480 [Nanohaloarchaea archaeon]|nr:hypothetical protein [Candidatus Nanohaloarchaea archaeon]